MALFQNASVTARDRLAAQQQKALDVKQNASNVHFSSSIASSDNTGAQPFFADNNNNNTDSAEALKILAIIDDFIQGLPISKPENTTKDVLKHYIMRSFPNSKLESFLYSRFRKLKFPNE